MQRFLKIYLIFLRVVKYVFHISEKIHLNEERTPEILKGIWYKGTGLRPYLEQLSADDQKAYSDDVMQCLMDTYPIQKNGEIIFRFPRLFFVAQNSLFKAILMGCLFRFRSFLTVF